MTLYLTEQLTVETLRAAQSQWHNHRMQIISGRRDHSFRGMGSPDSARIYPFAGMYAGN